MNEDLIHTLLICGPTRLNKYYFRPFIISKIFLSGNLVTQLLLMILHFITTSPRMLIFNGGNATDLIIRSDQPSKLCEG